MFDRDSRGFISYFLRAYPGRTALLVFLLTLSGIAEGVGIGAMLPLLELTTKNNAHPSQFSVMVGDALAAVGLQPHLPVLLLLIVAGMTLKALFRLLAMKQVGYTVAHVATDMRLSLLRALLRSRWSYFVSQPAGRFANAIGTEATRAATAYRSVSTLLASAIQVIVYMVVAFLVSWQIALFGFFGGLVVVAVLGRLVGMSRDAGKRQTQIMRSLISRLTDALQGIKPIKAMGREEHLQPLLEAETHGLNDAQEDQVLAAEAVTAAQEPILVVLMAVALYFLLTVGHQSFATVLVTAFLFYRLAGRISQLQTNYQAIAVGESAFWSMHENIAMAEAQHEVRGGETIPPRVLEQGITMNGVSFGYGERRVLNDVSLRIPAGCFVALIGPSGAGKTTIADLIVGLYEPGAGEILVDGVPLREVNRIEWRKRIGYVPQEMFLFHDTLLQNVTLGDPEVSRAAVEEALRAAGAWEFVAQLPDGLDTVLGERGSRLSGGQRQRIAIARALVREPSLLVLDEVTTALDPLTEAAICGTLQELASRVTILAISHQPAMMAAADVVYRLEGGRATRLEDPQTSHAALT
ncbi:MAG TPA: ABC transporter ATP-binding protein [Longimicrobiaceae bacterium]|nr:ABC transporter ATP-binding protein [Longimicrobiaceae bacterium]